MSPPTTRYIPSRILLARPPLAPSACLKFASPLGMKNFHASDFIDKCSARFHFEQRGVEIYELVITKCPPGLRARFQKILGQEKKHSAILAEVLEKYGANPYALTRSSKVPEIEAPSILKAARKSDFRGLMDTLLTIELVDTANWELLVLLAEKMGDRQASVKFRQCLADESEHLRFIHRHILKELTGKTRVPRLKAA